MESLTDEGYRPLRLKISDGNCDAAGFIDYCKGIGSSNSGGDIGSGGGSNRDGDVYCRYYKSMAETKGKVNETNKAERMGKGVQENIYEKKESVIKSAVIFVGGVGGGWDSPARGLYHSLSIRLSKEMGITSLRVRFRHSTDLDSSVKDVLAGIEFLTKWEKVASIGLVGHSFGGAVVISSAALVADAVKTIVTLSTQSYGTEGISKLREGQCTLLLIHGNNDDVLSPYCSLYVHKKAKVPKQLIIYDSASHSLDEVADKVHQKVYNWIIRNLAKG